MAHMKQASAEIANLMVIDSERKSSCWDRLLDLQVQAFFAHELQFYYSSADWMQSEHVLDVGCGNGRYTTRLAEHFSGKKFLGIDLSDDLINIAGRSHASKNVAFQQTNFTDFRSDHAFDAILMRLVLQHMSDLEGVFARSKNLLTRGGCFIIIEPDISLWQHIPETPDFFKLIAEYEKDAARQDVNRPKLLQLGKFIEEQSDWTLVTDRAFSVPNIGPFSGTNLEGIYDCWIELLRLSGIDLVVINNARHEISNWMQKENTFNEIGVHIWLAKYTGPMNWISL